MCASLGAACSGEDGGESDAGPHPCELEAQTVCADKVAGGQLEEDQTSACVSQESRTCLTDYYLRQYSPFTGPSCDPTEGVIAIRGDAELSLFYGVRVADSSVRAEGQWLQRYFEPNELWFHALAPSRASNIEYALTGTEKELERALALAGLPTRGDLTPEQQELATKVIMDVVFAPTRAFIQQHALPATPTINVVVLREVVSPFMQELFDGTIVGLGVSPALLSRLEQEDAESKRLYDMLAIQGDFSPTLFVGHDDITRLVQYRDQVIAHELGHVLGLVHVDQAGNLMKQSEDKACRPGLTQEQVSSLEYYTPAATPRSLPPSATKKSNSDSARTLAEWRQLRELPSRVLGRLRAR